MIDRVARELPRTGRPDSTLAFFKLGYEFISTQCDALESDAFITRIMLTRVVCMRGPQASLLLYGVPNLTRVGSMPMTVLKLLQDIGSVQQLDGKAHLRRKAMFVDLLMDETKVEELATRFHDLWIGALPRWRADGAADLMKNAYRLLTQAAHDWAGIPEGYFDTEALAGELARMIASTGHFGPRTFATLLSRREVEKTLVRLVGDVRSGRVGAGDGTALAIIAAATDVEGRQLDPEICAVELLNVLRPIAAVSRYVVYAALALEKHPPWRDLFAAGDEDRIEGFVEEVRRFYPFFPLVGAVADERLNWAGREWKKGQWFLLDLYGTTHDPRYFPQPHEFRPERDLSWRKQDYSFIPQGAGNTRTTHRCPGEQITVRLMVEAVRILSRDMRYAFVPGAGEIRLDNIPAKPEQTTIRIS